MSLKPTQLRLLGAAAMVGGLAGCNAAGGFTGPETPPSVIAGPAAATSAALFSCETSGYGSVTRRIGAAGGTLKVGPHELFVPPGALDTTVNITATAPAGPTVRVTVLPHGLEFKLPAALLLSYKDCSSAPPASPSIAYVDAAGGTILELLPSKSNRFKRQVSAGLNHFSGYAIAD